MGAILSIRGVNKAFGGVVTAKDITFDVMPGRIHGLIGPNGAGKSTLMNMISGILPLDSGSIFLEDTEITRLPAYTRSCMGVGRTFQTPRFLNQANLEVNLRLATDLKNHKTGYLASFFKPHDRSFMRELKEYMELAGFTLELRNEVSSLTYGQLKILEIIRSLLAHPKVILVDEPCAGLNDKETENVVALLRKAAYEQNIGVLVIEHTMDMIMSVCEEIVVINFGEVIAHGTPAHVSSNEQVITAYLGRDADD